MRFVWKIAPLAAALAPVAAWAQEPSPEDIILPMMGILIPLSVVLGGTAVLIVALLAANRTARLRQETIQLAIKEGRELPPELFMRVRRPRRDPLLGGLVLTALGVALSIALGAVAGWAQAVWGLIPLLVGIALLVYVPLYRKQKKED